MATPLKRAVSLAAGWLADRKLPTPLRAPIYSAYARLTGARLDEVRPPLAGYPSLGAFFVRRLVDGARPIDQDPAHTVAPVDGTVQALDPIRSGTILQAKGRAYAVRELLAGVGEDVELEGGFAWTIYLGPRDYHRIHAPEACRLVETRWVPGARYSVNPRVLARRPVLSINERCVLRLETGRGPLLFVLVGALNVGRIRVVGVEPGADGPLGSPLERGRGAELARFEMGSTVVLLAPPGYAHPLPALAPGQPIRLGAPIGRAP